VVVLPLFSTEREIKARICAVQSTMPIPRDEGPHTLPGLNQHASDSIDAKFAQSRE